MSTTAPPMPTDSTSTVSGTELHWGDIVVIVLYFVAVISVGLVSSLRNRGSVGGYFLAGRSMHWIPVGASLFASNIGSGHFIGLAGSGAASGIGIAVFELNAIFILMLLGWVFVPVYIAAGVFTMPEYLRKRFGGQRIRIYLAVLALILYVFTKISADLYSGALFIEQSLHWDLYLSVIVLLLISALFTICGGLTAVIWTDFIQTIIMIIGAFVLMIISFNEIGGYSAAVDKFFQAIPSTSLYSNSSYNYSNCGIPPSDSMNFFRGLDDPDLPWFGVIFGLTVSGVWYWCSDQPITCGVLTLVESYKSQKEATLKSEHESDSKWVIVQRALAAKNLSHAKAGTLLAGYLKFLPLFLIVIPGMIARILYPDRVGCADPDICMEQCKSRSGCTNMAYPLLVIKLMPDGARGLMLAVMMSALMSSLTSIFNSSSTIFTMDIWRRIRKNASETELMIVGRLFVVVLVAVSVVWIPIVQNVSELFHYIQAVTSYLAPPVCAVYVLGVLWKRINEKGAFWGLMVGLVCGLIRFAWEYAYPVYPCGEGHKSTKPDIISKMHYLHFGILLFGISAIVTIVISLLTKPIDDKHLHRLTFWSRHNTDERIDIAEAEKLEMREIEGVDNYNVQVSDVNLTDKEGDSPGEVDIKEDEPLPFWKKAIRWICGIEKIHEMSDEEKQAIETKHMSIEQDKTFSRILNTNAVILMSLAMFLWGFFA